MRKSLLCLSFLAIGVGACAGPPMDHFLVYQIEEIEANFQVRLTDQFDSNPKEAALVALTHFANPTRKIAGATQEGIKDGNRHLTWYTLQQPMPEPRRTIRFLNQFGQHSVDTRDPRFLLLPAQKTSDANSSFPGALDHYKCYEVTTINTAPTLPAVTVGDQFASQGGVPVSGPILFCLPVKKEREGETAKEIGNQVDHFAVYELQPQVQDRSIEAQDQFGKRALRVVRRLWLAVPSEKQAVVTHPN